MTPPAPGARLDALLQGSPYLGYPYAYPHKLAYRPLPTAVPLRDVWADEPREALFLYVHVPFCEFRCGYCNLLSRSSPDPALVTSYLDAVARQAEQVGAALGDRSFARFAVGGGTPTWLAPAQLEQLFDTVEGLGATPRRIPVSLEMSPETVTPERLALLRERGVDRASIGIQSFVADEVRAAGRPQRSETVERALGAIREAGFPDLNIDLIYGLPGQTVASWEASLERALAYEPEELYLYPLYVRRLTGLGRRGQAADDALRLACYRSGRDRLLAAGYTQVSMRAFRAGHAPSDEGPTYCCQEDGMIGLGCGARSYTRSLHYSEPYAVGRGGVQEILQAFAARSDAELARADYGFRLDDHEQRRRWVIKSLLWREGLALTDYEERFAASPLDDLPELRELEPRGLAELQADRLLLTPAGLERSDVLGPWLYSARVTRLMEEFDLR